MVATPGRCIDHLNRGNLDLSEINIAVLDEADEMLNMGFADDVEKILQDGGSANEEVRNTRHMARSERRLKQLLTHRLQKPQVLLFSATTPDWVTSIANDYQENALRIDATTADRGARTAKTVRHLAIQIPPSRNERAAMLEDIIAVEISKDAYLTKINLGPELSNIENKVRSTL